ncbi:MAG: TIM barrel protein [Pirellulaceae bacterium]
MYKNFAAQGLGISGRQSELIELALTYGFRGLDIDLSDMYRRVQRSDFDHAARFLHAAEVVVSGFDVPINLDADDDSFTAQLAQLHPAAEVASKLKAKVGSIVVPAGTDRKPYHEYFEEVTKRLNQIAECLGSNKIRLAVGFHAATEFADGKKYEFIRNVEGFLPLVKGAGDNIGFLIDTFNWFGGAGTLEQLKGVKPESIYAVRLSAISEGADKKAVKRADRALPSETSSIDFVAIAKHLVSGKYSGPVSAYSAPGNVRGNTRETVANKAQEALDEIFTGAGLVVAPRPMDTISDIVVDMMME